MMRAFLPLIALALLAACADSEPPEAVQADEGVYNSIDQVKAPLADEGQPAIGQWIRSMQEEKPALQFGPPNTEPLFSIRCDDGEGLILQRHGLVQMGTAQMMTVILAGTAQQLAVNPVSGPLPVLRAALPAGDALIGGLGDTSEPIRIEVGEEPPLILPTSPMIGEFIDGCVNPAAAATAESSNGSAETNSAE